jgi:hypothetical protein
MLELVIVEPFHQYPTTFGEGGVESFWNIVSNGSTGLSTGILGTGKGVSFPHTTGNDIGYMRRAFTPSQKVTLAWSIKMTQLGILNDGLSQSWLKMYDEAAARQFGIRMNNNGQLVYMSAADAIIQTGEFIHSPEQVYRYCMSLDMTVPNATEVTLTINGVPDDSLTGTFDLQGTTSQLLGMIHFEHVFRSFSTAGAFSYILGDVILGIEEAQQWGPIEILMNGPIDDVEIDWTRLSGAENYEMVDELPFDLAATYNQSSTIGHKDMLQYALPTQTPEFVLAQGILLSARKEDSAVREIAGVLRVDGVDYLSANINLEETWNHHRAIWVENPDTVAPWEPSEIVTVAGYEYRT